LAGNVWEWTRSLYEGYPYDPDDGRENLEAGDEPRRVVRGGAFYGSVDLVRCAFRVRNFPPARNYGYGFRVVVSPFRRAQHGDTSGI
jgi:formylglycine-generating enzyme required for sulfatase activity